MSNNHTSIPTSAIIFNESEHGRLRRQQRGIDRKDLKRAMKYGQREIQYHRTREGHQISKYTLDDIVYIVDDYTRREITSYAKSFPLELVTITPKMRQDHEEAVENIQNNLQIWTSNTVLVVDTSGSMRAADVWGARTRLSAVWLTVALDFIAQRIESGSAGMTDVVSMITLGEESETICLEQPTDWILYNRVVEVYNDPLIQPRGHGPYLESLRTARSLLERNPIASCAACLMFLSDGKPSHELFLNERLLSRQELILEEVRTLAKTFGRRLTFQCVGVGDMDNFATLESMVNVAKDYGVISDFCLPSMSTTGLGDVFTSVVSSLITVQSEMTDLGTMKQEKVRHVSRESLTEASQIIRHVNDDRFVIYPAHCVQRKVYTETRVEQQNEESDGRKWKWLKTYEKVPLYNSDSHYVAIAKEAFGEGAERYAFRFFEVKSDRRSITGTAMVAKDGRFESTVDSKLHPNFIKTFCSTQQLARRLANEFNKKLDETYRVDKMTPRISFLDCSIYELTGPDGSKKELLVEEKLDHNLYQKWNSNNGYVDGMDPKVTSPREMMKEIYRVKPITIIEEDEEDEGSEDEEHNNYNRYPPVLFSPNEVAQAFSHYTYWASGRKRLVCDLQGVYDERSNQLKLTDPVIHYHNPNKEERRYVHGRTDKGANGVNLFFGTHKEHCGHLCKLVLRGLRKRNPSQWTHQTQNF